MDAFDKREKGIQIKNNLKRNLLQKKLQIWWVAPPTDENIRAIFDDQDPKEIEEFVLEAGQTLLIPGIKL